MKDIFIANPGLLFLRMDLNTPISELSRVGKATSRYFRKLGLETFSDLLFYYPFCYDDFSRISDIAGLVADQTVTVRGKILGGDQELKKHPLLREKLAELRRKAY